MNWFSIFKFCFYVLLAFYCLWFILWMIRLYKKYHRPVMEPEFNAKKITPPSTISPTDLAYLVDTKITPSSFAGAVLELLEKKAIRLTKEENSFLLVKEPRFDSSSLSKSMNYLLELLFHGLGERETVNLKRLEEHATNNKTNSEFLLNYQIWKKIATTEAILNRFFEPKIEYHSIRIFRNFGITLALFNYLLGYHFILGYAVLLPAFYLVIYFSSLYQRTKEATSEYKKWINFRFYLKDDPKKIIVKDKLSYLKYGAVLGVVASTEKKVEANHTFASYFVSLSNRLVRNATLFGNRSLFK